MARDCAALADPARTLLGSAQEQWLAQGWSLDRPWNLVAQQTLMARFTGPDGRYWTDGWDGYPAPASGCWPPWPSAACPAWWCWAATCTRTTWPT
jgi:phosphodiesterase/alkaline phosphatase D-like protein